VCEHHIHAAAFDARFHLPAFEEDIIWNDNCRSTVDLQQLFYMLHKVQLLVAGGCPEIITDNGRRLALDFTFLRYKCEIRSVYEQMAAEKKSNKRPFDMAVSDYFAGNDLLWK
jgi:hypothetical protein